MGKLPSILLSVMFLMLLDTCFAKVKWTVQKKIFKFGDDLVLFCTAEDYSMNSTEAKRWQGGHEQRLLALNGVPAEDYASKYKMNIQQNGFSLIIRNTTKADFDISYVCTYGFNASRSVVLKIGDAFEVKANNRESNGIKDNSVTIIIITSVSALSVIIMIIVGFIVHLCRKRQRTKNQKKEKSANRGKCDSDRLLASWDQKGHSTTTINDTETVVDEHKPRPHSEEDTNDGTNTDTAIRINGKEESGELIASSDQKGHGRTTIIGTAVAISGSRHEGYENDGRDTYTPIRKNGKMPNADAKNSNVTLKQDQPADESNSVLSLARCDPVEPTNKKPDRDSKYGTMLQDVTPLIDPNSTSSTTHAHLSSSDYQKMKLSNECQTKYKKYIERINSFHLDWPISRPSILKMAKAGFFYRGHGTKVQCFDCGAKMCWQEGDDPFEEAFHNDCLHLQKENSA